jgi:hypothetical protein
MENWRKFSRGLEIRNRKKEESERFPVGKWAVFLALVTVLGAGQGSQEADWGKPPKGFSEVMGDVFPDMDAFRASWGKIRGEIKMAQEGTRRIPVSLAEFLKERVALRKAAEKDLVGYVNFGGNLEGISAAQILNTSSGEREEINQFTLFRIFLYYYQEYSSYSLENLEPLFDKLFSEDIFPKISQNFSSKGLPEELVLVPIVESMLRPEATSSKGARGNWQFWPATAQETLLKHPELKDILVFKSSEEQEVEFAREESEKFDGKGGSPRRRRIDWEGTLERVDQLVTGSRVAACFFKDLMNDERIDNNISLAILAYNGGLVRNSSSYPRFLEENPKLKLGWNSFSSYLEDLFQRGDDVNKENVAENVDYIFRLMAVLERANEYFEKQGESRRFSIIRLAGDLGQQIDLLWGAYKRLGLEGSED